ncbi:MAG: polyprenyl diphosphate synthase [Candidatus Paceibacteria bacterium]
MDKHTTPIRSIGVIMDGNRRWAKARGLPGVDGHQAGIATIKRLGKEARRLAKEYGLESVTLYAFSVENWNRSPEEVAHIMELIRSEFAAVAEELDKENVRVRVIGARRDFPEDIQAIFTEVEEKTKGNTGIVVAFALSYGGRADIIHAVNRAVQEGREVDEAAFSNLLATDGMQDPDLVIRTSGEQRLSGFLPWESVYSELFFVDEHWPEMTIEKLEEVFKEYQSRERRHGK